MHPRDAEAPAGALPVTSPSLSIAQRRRLTKACWWTAAALLVVVVAIPDKRSPTQSRQMQAQTVDAIAQRKADLRAEWTRLLDQNELKSWLGVKNPGPFRANDRRIGEIVRELNALEGR